MSIRIATIALPRPRRLPLRQMYEVARQRRELAQLDDAILADLGLSRHDAQREAARPFWDLAGTACA
ncbi:DUF1127 domain-containing protein [Roseovarius ramblicola]|uniref:DUF1127 domain-containing protein n=1 Tax=Roseovarius ramblicola TaxID=2022336 RepID=A0ABV5I0X7_9RHOB